MTTINKKKFTWLALVPIAVLAVGIIVAFVRVQVHAEDVKQHMTREVLQEEYVPRNELDHRLDAQMKVLTDIRDDVKELRHEVRELD